MILHALALLAVTAISLRPLAAQEPPVLSLEEALRLFAVNNVEMRLARARADEAGGLARQARSFTNPRLDATHESLSDAGASYSESYLMLSQLVELSGERGARVAMSDRRWETALLELRADSLRLAFEVKQAYMRASLAQARRDVTLRVAEVFRAAAQSAAERYEAGDVSLYEVERIRVERARYETLVTEAELEDRAAQRSLALLVAPEGARFTAEPLPEDPPAALDLGPLAGDGIERRPELAAARSELDEQFARVRIARAERVPDLTATGGFKRQSAGVRGAFLGMSLPIPVFDRNAGTIDAAHAGARAAEERLALTRRLLEQDALRAAETYDALRERASLLAGLRADSGPDLLEIARIAYDEGDMDLVGVLDAAEALHQARTADARLMAELWIARFDLERALGGAP